MQMFMRKAPIVWLGLSMALGVAGCSTTGNRATVVEDKDTVLALLPLEAKRDGGRYKVGKPYSVKGVTYRPEEDYGYREEGMASWYGPGFDGRRTANGEIFDQDLLTAAHRTLPMPSLVEVTNLSNGKSVVVRVNDRGPFSRSRIIDLSKKAADMLGFLRAGTVRVSVRILPDSSMRLARGENVPRDPSQWSEVPVPPTKPDAPRAPTALAQAPLPLEKPDRPISLAQNVED